MSTCVRGKEIQDFYFLSCCYVNLIVFLRGDWNRLSSQAISGELIQNYERKLAECTSIDRNGQTN